MTAIICTTPFHLFSAINFVKNGTIEEKSDLFLLNNFRNASEVFKNLKNSNIFGEIFILDEDDFTSRLSENNNNTLDKVKLWLNLIHDSRQFMQGLLPPLKVYSTVFIACWSSSVFLTLVIENMFRLNPELKINYFDEGLGSYRPSNIIGHGKKHTIMKRIARFRRYQSNQDKWELYAPELLLEEKGYSIKKIDNHRLTDGCDVNVYNEIFGYYPLDHSLKEIIFDQVWDDSMKEMEKNLDTYYLEIKSRLPKIRMKMHPRRLKDSFINIEQLGIDYPWEVFCLNNDVNDYLLISYYSTACFTPKLIFNQEPFVVFLFMLDECTNISNLDLDYYKLVEKFKNMYTHPERVFIPQTKLELIDIINNKIERR